MSNQSYEPETRAVALIRDGSSPVYSVDTPQQTMLMNDDGGRQMFGDQDWELALEGYHPEITLTRINVTRH